MFYDHFDSFPLHCVKIPPLYHNLHSPPPAVCLLEPAPVNAGVRLFWLDEGLQWRCDCDCEPGTEDYRSKLGGDCFADLACPDKCRCEGTTVDCSNQKLTKIPDHIPQYTAELWVTLYFSTICVWYVEETWPWSPPPPLSLSPLLFSLFVSDHLLSSLFLGVWTTMNSLCSRRQGSSKSCLSWGRCESDMLQT